MSTTLESSSLKDRLDDARRTIDEAAAEACRRLSDQLTGDGFRSDGAVSLALAINGAREVSTGIGALSAVLWPPEFTGRIGTRASID